MSQYEIERLARRLLANERRVDGQVRAQQASRTIIDGATISARLAAAREAGEHVSALDGQIRDLDATTGAVIDDFLRPDVSSTDAMGSDYRQWLDEQNTHLAGADGVISDLRDAVDSSDADDPGRTITQSELADKLEDARLAVDEVTLELDEKLESLEVDLETADGKITAAKDRADAAFGKAETAESAAGDATTAAGTALSTATGAATAASAAQSVADTARQEATDKSAAAEQAAKTYAEAQAVAAQAAAEATAAADALAKANAARDAAVGTAAADATTKAADALAAAEADATAKAAAAEAAAKVAAAADATAKADAAEAAAKAVANTAQSRADSAHALAGTAEGNAQAALTMAGSKARVTYSTSAPSGTASAGDLHRRLPTAAEITAGATAGDVMQEWRSLGGTSWQETKISSQAIANLDVGKLTVQSGVISDLVAQHIAARTAAFQEVSVENLFVTAEAVMRQAVIDKLYVDVVKAKMLTVTEKIIAHDIFATGVVGAAALAATAIDGKVITGAFIRTGATGMRWEIAPAGISGFDQLGQRTIVMTPGVNGVLLDVPGNVTAATLGDQALRYHDSGNFDRVLALYGATHVRFNDSPASNFLMSKNEAELRPAKLKIESRPGNGTQNNVSIVAETGPNLAELTFTDIREIGGGQVQYVTPIRLHMDAQRKGVISAHKANIYEELKLSDGAKIS